MDRQDLQNKFPNALGRIAAAEDIDGEDAEQMIARAQEHLQAHVDGDDDARLIAATKCLLHALESRSSKDVMLGNLRDRGAPQSRTHGFRFA